MPTNIIPTTLNDNSISESNGKNFNFEVIFSGVDESSTSSKLTNIILNGTSIKSFTWVNEINNILLTGELEYLDTTGEISKFFGSYLSYVFIKLSKNNSKMSKPDKSIKQEFDHLFIVNNYEIISRTGSIVFYRLYLVSAHWFNYIANIEYSTHTKEDEDPNEKDIFQIIYDVLKIAFPDNSYIKCDNETFSKKSGINLDYCTTTQSSFQSIIKYLQNKMIYFQDKINCLNFLVLDEFSKKIKLLGLGNDSNEKVLNSNNLGTIIGLFGSDVEENVSYNEQNFKSVIKKSNCQAMKALLETTMWNYDSTSNIISSYNLGSNEITDIGINNNFIKNENNSETYIPIFKKEFFYDKANQVKDATNYSRIGTIDNNNFSIYNDLLENITNRNSLILETVGEISHQPGQLFFIKDDSEIVKTVTDISNENIKDKFRMFTGLFYIFKVRHVFKPGDSEGNAFYERLFISRTHNKELELKP